jgi:hypothetical protein
MSAVQNLGYSAIQVVHNFGAVATVGGSIIAVQMREEALRRRLAHLVLFGWVAQAASGASFGLVTYYYYQHLPDISGIAVDALSIKMICASLGILLLMTYLWQSERWTDLTRSKVWISSAALAITAISAAAFLRWFS